MQTNACKCSIDLAEQCDVWIETDRKARKQHRCCECREPIEPGEKYIQINSVYDGSASTDRMCSTCRAIWRDLFGCVIIGELRNEIWQCLGIDYVTGEMDPRFD